MPLKKSTGNMYDWVTHTWAPIKGKCKHECDYCYMKRFPLPDLHLDEKDLNTKLGEGKVIFVGHTCDLFADDVPSEWISQVLEKCRKSPLNKYLFQSKNPIRFMEFVDQFPPLVILGTTIETNRTTYVESKASTYTKRAEAIGKLGKMGYETIVTIEPIYDFDIQPMIDIMISAQPKWVNLGADSKGNNVPEPSQEKIISFVKKLQSVMDIRLKNNLKRIIGDFK